MTQKQLIFELTAKISACNIIRDQHAVDSIEHTIMTTSIECYEKVIEMIEKDVPELK